VRAFGLTQQGPRLNPRGLGADSVTSQAHPSGPWADLGTAKPRPSGLLPRRPQQPAAIVDGGGGWTCSVFVGAAVQLATFRAQVPVHIIEGMWSRRVQPVLAVVCRGQVIVGA